MQLTLYAIVHTHRHLEKVAFHCEQGTSFQMSGSETECAVCMDSFPAGAGVTCCSASAGHFHCAACFNGLVVHQTTGVGFAEFVGRGNDIVCAICRSSSQHAPFDMRICSPLLTPAAYSSYLKALSEASIVAAQRETTEQFEAKLRDISFLQQRLAQLTMQPYVLHVVELICPRCPVCKVTIGGFDHGADFQCGMRSSGRVFGGCGSHLCAWCMCAFPDNRACHSHVLNCSLNANPGNLFPVESTHPRVWREVQNGLARARVKQYIASQVPQELRQAVTDYIQAQFPEIQLAHRDPSPA